MPGTTLGIDSDNDGAFIDEPVAAYCQAESFVFTRSLLAAVRRSVNYFQPSFKLRERIRVGAKVKPSYHPPATPRKPQPPSVESRIRTEQEGTFPVPTRRARCYHPAHVGSRL